MSRRPRTTKPKIIDPDLPVRLIRQNGMIEVNPYARWGQTRIWRCVRAALKAGTIREAKPRIRSDRLRFVLRNGGGS